MFETTALRLDDDNYNLSGNIIEMTQESPVISGIWGQIPDCVISDIRPINSLHAHSINNTLESLQISGAWEYGKGCFISGINPTQIHNTQQHKVVVLANPTFHLRFYGNNNVITYLQAKNIFDFEERNMLEVINTVIDMNCWETTSPEDCNVLLSLDNEINEGGYYIDYATVTSNYETITLKVEKEFFKYSSYVKIDIDEAKRIASDLSHEVAKINFKDIAVEFTPTNSIKYKIVLEEGKLLIINKPFSDIEGLQKDQVIFSVIVNRELIISDTSNLSTLVQGINEYISK